MLDSLFVALQYILPRHWLTAVIWRIARIRNARIKDFLITQFARAFDVDLDEVKLAVPGDFATFNEFFIRELKDGAREIDEDADALVSPVDGTVSVAGDITGDSVFQAKGLDYSLGDLLATDLEEVERYVDGRFATIYLAPYNYHRVHAPFWTMPVCFKPRRYSPSMTKRICRRSWPACIPRRRTQTGTIHSHDS